MIKTKVAFLEGWLLSNQSEQSEKFSKNSDWLEKSRPSKKPLLFWSCKQANSQSVQISKKEVFYGGPVFSSQSEVFETFLNRSDWLDKSWPFKKSHFFLDM